MTTNTTNDLRKLIESRTRAKAVRGLKDDRSFSSFWMDNDDWGTSLPGQSFGRKGGNLVELIKLNAYRKAVINFVKIISKKDIPVVWYGDISFTNGKAICLSSDISAKNFDVVVGLALHEASHVLLTDFKVLDEAFKFNMHPTPLGEKVITLSDKLAAHFNVPSSTAKTFIHGIHNWIEDRRIDHFVFSTSPGYKAYYHKLYDHYWNTKDVIRGIRSSGYRISSKLDSWEFQIYNFLSPAVDLNAMPGLKAVYDHINLNNPQRWTSVQDTLNTTFEVIELILANAESAAVHTQKQLNQLVPPSSPFMEDSAMPTLVPGLPPTKDEDEEDQQQEQLPKLTEHQEAQLRKQLEVNELFGSQDEQQQEGEEVAVDQPTAEDTSAEAARSADKALNAQRDFLNGRGMKTEAKRSMQKQLEDLSTQDLELQTTQFNGVVAVVQDYTGANVLNYLKLNESEHGATYEQRKEIEKQLKEANNFGVDPDDFKTGYRSSLYIRAIQQGIELGGLLSRKLVQHSEQRVTVTNRLRSGKIDARRIPHVGYGIESIFSQTNIAQCKPSHIHLDLDASASMADDKWQETIKMTIAIARAASKAQKISVSVAIRKNMGEQARTMIVYDSRRNKFHHLVALLGAIQPAGGTPEGLCFDALITGKYLTPGSPTLDSYFINLSDGEPAGPNNYYGNAACHHTRKQIERMDAIGIKTLSYFIGHCYNPNQVPKCSHEFISMYGASAKAVDTKNVTQIASTINALLMSSHQ